MHVKAGQTVTVELYPSLADFTQVDKAGERHELAGEYSFHFGVAETVEHGGAYAEHKVMTY